MFAKRRNNPAGKGRLTSLLILTLSGLTLLVGFLTHNQPVLVNAQGSSASTLTTAVNSLRSANDTVGIQTNHILRYVTGASNGSNGSNPGAFQNTVQPGSQPGGPTATLEVLLPIQVATPAADGSIIHIVEEGQFLITIAESYKISLAELFRLNNLTDQSVIYPGQRLLIKVADRTREPTPSETIEATTPPPPTPSPTRRPTRTPRSTATEVSEASISVATDQNTATPNATSNRNEATVYPASRLDPMLILIGGLFGFGALMVLFGTVFRRRK